MRLNRIMKAGFTKVDLDSVRERVKTNPNLSYNKRVGFRVNVDGLWRDVYAIYSNSLMTNVGNGCEAWSLKQYGELLKAIPIPNPLPPKPLFQMAVFYQNLDWGT